MNDSTSDTIKVDTARLPLLLRELRLPTIAAMWQEFTERADREGWPAARLLATLTELELAERDQRRIQRHLLEARLQEPIVVVMPSDHRFAAREAIAIQDVAAETFLGMSKTAPVLQVVIGDYLKRSGIEIRATHEIDNLGMAISLVASTRGVALLPAYARNFLPWSVTSRPLEGETPTIDLVIGYQKANRSPILKLFLSRIDDLIARVAHETRATSVAPAGRSTAPFSRAN